MTDPTKAIVLVAHHKHTCGGLLPDLLAGLGQVQLAYPLHGQSLPSIEQVRGVVIQGSSHGVNDRLDGLNEERQWVETALTRNIPVMGICFGAQLIAQISGGRVVRGPDPERGALPVFPCEGQDVLPHPMIVMQWHQDGIYDLPSCSQRIASSDLYPEQVFQIGSAVGIQFHAETTPAMLDRWLEGNDAGDIDRAARMKMFADLEAMNPMRLWLGGRLRAMFGQD